MNTIEPKETTNKGSLFQSNLVTGLFIVIPVLVTLWIGWWSLSLMTDWAVEALRTCTGRECNAGINIAIRIAAFILIVAAVFFVGLLARITFGKKLIGLLQKIMLRIPLLKIVYSTCQQIGETVKTQRGGLFQKAVLFEYPMKGNYAIGFLTSTNETESEITRNLGKDMYCIFMPTTPNPTSGFLILVPKKDCIILEMSAGDAMKLIVSGGVILPGQQEQCKEEE